MDVPDDAALGTAGNEGPQRFRNQGGGPYTYLYLVENAYFDVQESTYINVKLGPWRKDHN